MCRVLRTAALLVGVLTFTSNATAGTILQDTTSGGNQILAFSPMGQSFTAEDPFVSFAFFYEAINPGQTNVGLQLDLRAGTTVVGAPLISVPFVLPAVFLAYFDVDLSAVTLTPGNVYTASVTTTNGRWAAQIRRSGNPYLGGVAILEGAQEATQDWRFRVTPVAAAIPEPATLLLLGTGLGIAGMRRRMKKRG